MLLTAVFADKVGLIFGETATFLTHLSGLGIVTAFTFCGSLALYYLSHLLIPMRVSQIEEELGLDFSQHEETLGDVIEQMAAPQGVVKRAVNG
jgi:Amt family ammonium transporter